MQRFKLGQRVECVSIVAGVPPLTQGTIGLVAGVRGKSIYCDPSRVMVFVNWDTGQSFGVFKHELRKI